jgi:glycine cleavage system protein P-like pyridoxal-binding family
VKNTLQGCLLTWLPIHRLTGCRNAIKEITIDSDNGGQVYMDGANMNAQVGLTNPATSQVLMFVTNYTKHSFIIPQVNWTWCRTNI